MPGDVVFILGGALPVLYLSFLGIRYTKKGTARELPTETLFAEIATQLKGR